MTTSATVELPNGVWYYVGSDGYPDTIEPILEDLVQKAVDAAEEKYKEPDEYWVEELDQRVSAQFKPLDFYSQGDYHYRITEDQTIEEVSD